MRRYSLAAVVVLFALDAATSLGGDKKKADQEAVEQELQQLQGTWEQVSIEQYGQKVGFARGLAPLFIIRGDSYTVEVGGKVLERGRVRVYPGKRLRKSELIVLDGTAPAKTYPAIHEITGDELRAIFARNGAARPPGFAAGAQSGYAISTYRRVSPRR